MHVDILKKILFIETEYAACTFFQRQKAIRLHLDQIALIFLFLPCAASPELEKSNLIFFLSFFVDKTRS